MEKSRPCQGPLQMGAQKTVSSKLVTSSSPLWSGLGDKGLGSPELGGRVIHGGLGRFLTGDDVGGRSSLGRGELQKGCSWKRHQLGKGREVKLQFCFDAQGIMGES